MTVRTTTVAKGAGLRHHPHTPTIAPCQLCAKLCCKSLVLESGAHHRQMGVVYGAHVDYVPSNIIEIKVYIGIVFLHKV